MDTGLIILDHGSRRKKAVDDFLLSLAERASFLVPGDLKLAVAHLQFGRPDLKEAVDGLVRAGCRRIYVFPFFLLPGRHPSEDVPAIVEETAREHAGIEIRICPSLGEQPWLFEMVARWIIENLSAELRATLTQRAPLSGPEIADMSLDFAKGLAREALRPSCKGEEVLEIAARLIHATGDPSLAYFLRYSPDALERGIAALEAKGPVIVDVAMVKAGINRHLLERLGCHLYCAVEEAENPPSGTTRASWGMIRLASRLKGALVAVGNAPTALLSLLELIRDGVAAPSLVIGMPVGFVQAMEAKDLLKASGIPFVVLEGTKGGSAAAAAALNCLLGMAARKSVEDEGHTVGLPPIGPPENGG